MYSLLFTKMQGVGNDFVVIDGRNQSDTDWSVLAPKLCDRHYGVGADGLLVLDTSHEADFLMRMYNPDGSPDVCGNGLRCIARYARERAIVTSDQMTIQTLIDVRTTEIIRISPHLTRDPSPQGEGSYSRRGEQEERGAGEGQYLVRVAMNQPHLRPAEIPMMVDTAVDMEQVIDYPLSIGDHLTPSPSPQGEGRLRITALSTGSTHAVTFVDTLPDDATFLSLSPLVEHHPLFPERTSLMWCQPESETRFRLRIWERGAGETWGCGTGACATAVAAILQGYAPREKTITIASKGGELHIEWLPSGIFMTGPAEEVFTGELTP